MNAHRLQTFESCLFAAFAGLIVLSTLCTSDAPPGHGLFVVQSLLWTLLAVGTAAWCLWRPSGLQWTLVDSLVLAWMSWTAITTIAVAGVGDLRSAVNACWQTVAFCLAILLGRRLLTSPARQQAAGWLIMSLAIIAAMHGLFQYAVVTPAMRQAIDERPGVVLADAGIHAAVDSPEAKRFFDRARNSEPLASFTLTNSLAGFLLPGMVLIAVSLLRQLSVSSKQSTYVLGMLVGGLLILATCLLLTKSRTSMLAMMLGIAIIGLRWRGLPWKWLSLGAVSLLVIGVLVVMSGGLDWQVLSEAPKSVQYRVEYWRSTTAMIAEYPWLGVGPGNFQSVYTKYMLPQASETIADPHNLLFEIAATTGLPGLLIFVAMLVVCFRYEPIWEDEAPDKLIDSPFKSSAGVSPSQANYCFVGCALCLLLVPVITQLNEIDTNYLLGLPVLWWIGFPIFLLAAWLIRTETNLLSRESIPIALIVLLFNLLAAGGISFPSIALLIALLMALLTVEQVDLKNTTEVSISFFHQSRFTAWVGVFAATCLVSLCYLTGYKTVLDARRLLREAQMAMAAGQWTQANLSAFTAMNADPWDAELAVHCQLYWEVVRKRNEYGPFIAAAMQRNPRSARIFELAGDSMVANPNYAIEAYKLSVDRYPNSSLLHAKLAFAYGISNPYYSRNEAEEALRLDALNPHDDKKLANANFSFANMTKQQRSQNVEQLMRAILAETESQP